MPTTRSIARIHRASQSSINPPPTRVRQPDTFVSPRLNRVEKVGKAQETDKRPPATRWAEVDKSLTAAQWATWMALNTFAGVDGEAFPTQETIARRSRQGVRTVGRALVGLESGGLVEHQRRGRTSCTYRVVIDFPVRPKRQSGKRESAAAAEQSRPLRPTEGTTEGASQGETPEAPSKGALPAGVSLGTVELDRTSYVVPRTAATEAPTPLEAPPPSGADASVERPETALGTDGAIRPAGLYETALAERDGISVEDYRLRCAAARVADVPDTDGASSPKIRADAQATAKRNKARSESKRTPPGEGWVPGPGVFPLRFAEKLTPASVDSPHAGCPHCGDRGADGSSCRRCGSSLMQDGAAFRPSADYNAGGDP